MDTRQHQHSAQGLHQEEKQAVRYFSSWTCDTALTPSIIHDLQHMHLLSSSCLHCHCGAVLSLLPTTRGVDKYEYRCHTHGSNTHRTIRHDSWFEGKRHSIGTYIVVIRMLARGAHQHFISDETSVDRHSLHTLYRELCLAMVHALDHFVFTSEPFFAVTDIIECDECKIRWKGEAASGGWEEVAEHDEGEWVFGMITRRSEGADQRLMLFCTEGRRKDDLIEVIEEYVPPHTLICTDALVTYDALNTNYRHHTINKAVDGFAREGVDSVIGRFTVTVNSCEAMWRRLRRLGTERRLMRPSDVPLLCTEFVFRHYRLSWFALIQK